MLVLDAYIVTLLVDDWDEQPSAVMKIGLCYILDSPLESSSVCHLFLV